MTKLSSIRQLGISDDARMPHADITNAPELFGDPFGDIDDGDIDDGDWEDGDIDDGDAYGDINDATLAAFNTVSGDVYGGPRKMGPRTKRALKTAGIVAGAGLATGLGAALIKRAIVRNKRKKAAMRAKLQQQQAKQTIANQRNARENAGQIDRKKKVPFFQLTGAKMNSSPIDPMEGFIADMLKHNLDRQASDTPFLQETAIGIFAAGTWTCTANGVPTNRFYTGLILQLGINYLSAAPGTVFQVTATLPTINGPLVIAATPFLFTISKQYDVRFLFYPWQLVSNRPLPVLGQYSNANPITVAVTGLPANSSVNLIVPGSLHPWTVTLRNALIRS